MIQRRPQLFFSQRDTTGQASRVSKGNFQATGTRDALVDRLDAGIKDVRKVTRTLRLDPETDAYRHLARMIDGDYGSLSSYLEDAFSLFNNVAKCEIFLSSTRLIDKRKKTILEHRLTVTQDERGVLWTRECDDRFTISDGRSTAIISLSERKPSIYDYYSGCRIIAKNLDRNSRKYDSYRIYREGKSVMRAFIPIMYRKRAPVGVMVLEGDLRVKGCAREDPEEMNAFSVAFATAFGSQVAFMNTHKFDGTTKLKRKHDFEIEHEDAAKKLILRRIDSAFLLLIDLDHFKRINDMVAYAAGDAVLHQVGKVISESLRTPSASRWGGEEFVVLLNDIAFDDVRMIAKRINERISRIPGPKGISISCSIGAVDISALMAQCGIEKPKTPKELKDLPYLTSMLCRLSFRKCNDLIKRAKARGRDRLIFAQMLDGKFVDVEYINGSGMEILGPSEGIIEAE